MPTRTDILAAVPTCSHRERTGTPAQLKAGGGAFGDPCGRPLFSLHAVEKWSCRLHGPMLTWGQAAQQRRREAGAMFYNEAAA